MGYPMPPKHKPKWREYIITIVILILMIIVFSVFAQYCITEWEHYEIQSGDTLWSISQDRGLDPYRWVDVIAKENGIHPERLKPGQVIRVPMEKEQK